MDFSGFKTKSIDLIASGRETEARQALQIFGFSAEEADRFIAEVKVEKVQAELSGDRIAYLKNLEDGLTMVFTEPDSNEILYLERVTEAWAKMPTFTISLQRKVVIDPESKIEHIIFSWTQNNKFSGTSSKTASTASESTGDRAKTVPAPEPYKSWSEVVNAMLPDVIKAYTEKKGDNTGFNARRAVRDALKSGEISLAGYTAEMLDY